MTVYLLIYIVILHVLGALTFSNTVSNHDSKELSKSLTELPPVIRFGVCLLWPFFLIYWLGTLLILGKE